MYGSYGAFKRLGLSTTSHREPRMTQREWMSAYGTTNNLSRVSATERQQRRGPLPASTAQRNSQPHRSDSQTATVAAMVRAANVARQAEEERARSRPAEYQTRRRQEERKQDERTGQEDVQYSSDEEADTDEEEARSESGIEKQARADRRLQQLRKRHKADQEKDRKHREKTMRTRTLRRSQSDIQPAEERADGEEVDAKERERGGSVVALPSLGGVKVEDVRERTRLLLREALVKTDRDATEAVKAEEMQRQKRLQQQHSGNNKTRKRKRQNDEEAETSERQAEQKEEESDEDQYTLLASDIEQCLYEHHDFSHGTAYRQHSRSVLFSLVNNSQLTPALLNVTLSPQLLVTLPTAQLASADVAQLRAKEQQEATRGPGTGGGRGYEDKRVCVWRVWWAGDRVVAGERGTRYAEGRGVGRWRRRWHDDHTDTLLHV